jgi:hypothetical protein
VTVRVVESYSHEYPVFLKDDRVYLPSADGVFALQSPVVAAADVQPGLCSTSHACDPFFKAEQPDGPAFDIYVIVGWTVELAGDTHTNGASIVILADRFKGNGHVVKTGAANEKRWAGGAPAPDAVRGRNGLHAGEFMLYANVLHGVRIDTEGQDGEEGRRGQNGEGRITFDGTRCSGTVTKPVTEGTPGGDGGETGNVRVRLTSVSGLGPPRAGFDLTSRDGDFQCFADPALGCSNRLCTDNPSLAVCDIQTEADIAECRNGVDDDGDDLVDCEDPSCGQNPYVTVCTADRGFLPHVLEASAEACFDDVDNDGDGGIDCRDRGCSGKAICGVLTPEPMVSGMEEAEDATCADNLDNDLDGRVDCADPECRNNPFLTACGRDEKTLEACRDGVDNDGDGRTDCDDLGCSRNPYVIICNASAFPFMLESTDASCRDRIDNDKDGFRDCRDFQCLNNQLVTVCGDFENTVSECTDAIDNDGDTFIDCGDPNCRGNPFFGEYLCLRQIKTSKEVAPNAPFNGIYMDASAPRDGLEVSGGLGGFGGPSGRVCGKNPAGDICCIDEEVPSAARGAFGRDGSVSTEWIERRLLDSLRSLLSPRQWLVDMAVANKHFKSGDRQKASFGYTMNIMRIGGMLTTLGIDCAADPRSADFGRRFLASAHCSLLDRNILKLSYLNTDRNFFGFPNEALPNPRERFDRQFESFKTVYGVFDGNVGKWLTLSNAVDLNQILTQQAGDLHRRASDSAAELVIAQNRSRAAHQALEALTGAVANRTTEMKNLRDGVQALDERITARYEAQNGGIGQLVLDVASTALAAYGGAVLSKVGQAVFNEVKDTLVNGFKNEGFPFGAGSPSSSGTSAPPDAAMKLLDGLFKFAGEGASDDGIKKAATEGGRKLFDEITGATRPSYTPSLLLEEVSKELKIQRQAELALEMADLVLQQRKARTDVETAVMEEAMLRARHGNLDSAARRMDDYRNLTSGGAELTAFDKVLLGHQTYVMAATLLDELTVRYWRLLRQAEYEFLPFASATGENNMFAVVAERNKLDFNLSSYEPMLLNLNLVHDRFGQSPGTTQTRFYRRFTRGAETGPLFTRATDADLERLRAIGFPLGVVEAPHILRLRITDADLAGDPLLALQREVRVRNVRVNFLSAAGEVASVRVFAVRDARDSFRVSRRENVDGFATFELLPRDLLPTGAAQDGVHYKSFVACRSAPPTCTLSDSTCRTPFQDEGDVRTCSLLGPADDARIGTFFNRSLAGEWSLVVQGADLSSLGALAGVEIAFSVAAKDF